MVEPSIVEASAAAQAPAALIDSEQREQNEIKFTNGDAFRSVSRRFMDTQAIAAQSFPRVQAHELHPVRVQVGNQRYVKPAAALQCHAHDDASIEFAPEGQVDRNAATRAQPALSGDDTSEVARGLSVLLVGQIASTHAHGASHLIARRVGRGSGG
jgi:hypothetical protein